MFMPSRYKSTEDGYGSHIAVTDIKPGDLLTTTYVGEEHLLMSAPARLVNVLHMNIFFCQVTVEMIEFSQECLCLKFLK